MAGQLYLPSFIHINKRNKRFRKWMNSHKPLVFRNSVSWTDETKADIWKKQNKYSIPIVEHGGGGV